MTTATKQVSIHNLVAELRKFPEAAFDHTEQLRRFLQAAPSTPTLCRPISPGTASTTPAT
jgi:hypothetical protein